MDRDLSFLGRQNLIGMIGLVGPLPRWFRHQEMGAWRKDWLDVDVGIWPRPGGRWWHRAGSRGAMTDERINYTEAGILSRQGLLYAVVCDPRGLTCIAGEADMVAHVLEFPGAVVAALLLAALVVSFTTRHINQLIAQYWSFDARFRRHLAANSIVCAYQPVIGRGSDEMVGCEVLARWRDIDDRIIFPDRSVGIVERHGLTVRFTELVVRRAYEELCRNLSAIRKAQVIFKHYPHDLDSTELIRIFRSLYSIPGPEVTAEAEPDREAAWYPSWRHAGRPYSL